MSDLLANAIFDAVDNEIWGAKVITSGSKKRAIRKIKQLIKKEVKEK